MDRANKIFKETGKHTIFFCDEYNRAPKIVLQAMLPFLIEGIIHTHRINVKDAIVCACNPPTDDFEVNEVSDKAFLNRLGHIIFKPTHSEYIDFCKKKKLDAVTLKVIGSNTKFTSIKDFELPFDITPTRRSIFNVMSKVGKQPPAWINKHGRNVIETYLGTDFADAWCSEYSTIAGNITIDMLIDFDNNKSDIEDKLTTVIDGKVTPRLDILSKLKDVIHLYINDNLSDIKHNKVKVDWLIKLCNLPIVPDDWTSSVFIGNKKIKETMVKTLSLNHVVGTVFRQKQILKNNEVF
jgi:hypothetical protein